MQHKALIHFSPRARAWRLLAVSAGMGLLTSPALAGVSAGLAKAKTILDEANTGLMALGVVVVTIAILFVGFRMIFRNAQWADLAPVFWGGLLVGGAATIAGGLM